jgi:alkaline phosphatase
LLLFCLSAALAGRAAPIRNVIFCIGDGMGPEQVAAARCYKGANLFFESFPCQTRMTTFEVSGYVTDSAAAATALATGNKVQNGVLSLAIPGDWQELETVLETFQKQGKATGLVTTSYLTDATPAAFGAHTYSRGEYAQIAYDYLNRTRPEVLFGGSGGMSAEEALAAGYRVATDAASLAAVVPGGSTRVCGLFGAHMLPFEYDGLGELPSLTEMASKAVAVLSNDPDGFFLMVEGGRIDHACHANDLPRSIFETLAFEAAVGWLAEWAQGRGDTLILVMADHETGGLSVLADNGAGCFPEVSWSTGGHTSTLVPLYGWGVNAGLVTQVVDNTEVRAVALSAALMPAVGVGLERGPPNLTRTVWAVGSGDVYRVERSPTLCPPDWRPCGTVTAESARVTFADTNATGHTQGFYRMISLPQAQE